MNQHEVSDALQTLHELMVKWDWQYWAEFIERLIRLYHAQSDEFYAEMGSLSLWGGAGALWETVPRYHAKAYTYEDELRFRQAFIALAKYINDNQIGSEWVRNHAESIASTFEYWTGLGI